MSGCVCVNQCIVADNINVNSNLTSYWASKSPFFLLWVKTDLLDEIICIKQNKICSTLYLKHTLHVLYDNDSLLYFALCQYVCISETVLETSNLIPSGGIIVVILKQDLRVGMKNHELLGRIFFGRVKVWAWVRACVVRLSERSGRSVGLFRSADDRLPCLDSTETDLTGPAGENWINLWPKEENKAQEESWHDTKSHIPLLFPVFSPRREMKQMVFH